MKFLNLVLLSFIYLLLVGCSQSATKQEKSYVNPLMTVDSTVLSVADPFVYQYDNTYYLTGTTVLPEGEGFAYYTSTDLITWDYHGVLYRKPENHIGTFGFWAPEVKYYNGKFYLTYSCYVKERNLMLTCLAVSERPDGPFTDLYTPWFDLDYSAIDADIFVDEDATPYVYFSKNGMQGDTLATGELYVAKLKKDLSGLEGDPVFVSAASQPWEKVNWNRNRCNEGAFVFKKGGTYYMTYSANDTGYEFYGIGVSYADNPLGPWEKSVDNPLMTTDLSQKISSPGHNSIVEAPDGNLYLIYHRHADAFCQKPNWDRVVCMDRLYFDENGKIKMVGPTNTPQAVGW
ncbi:MAG: glycoside hydrolase family 43 protein [Massilibacteroides sp.]|nr:glycoside hydrolase family 43 protein [Massilibacteroides sp.]MDD3062707.1 glycoside hydrolase family 43 protein [Massilibacteroides sp.]MDD4116093.1 glycoside hydrolase family 43 protein [Massilibacteroides sp.]MDD4660200.1 glycoside hydrolase family 43 protein [Massilibacteroides sp.]